MLYPFESLRTRNGLPPSVLLPGSAAMKRACLVFAITLLVGVVPAQAAPSCRLPAGRTVADGRIAKLIAVPTPQGSALYACIRRSGRKLALDYDFSDARLNGRWAAWQRGRTGHWRIAVRDLRTGKQRLVVGNVAAHSLGVTARGSIVWAERRGPGAQTPLYANTVTQGGRLLDGGDVDASSVRLRGRRVSWLSGGARRTASIR